MYVSKEGRKESVLGGDTYNKVGFSMFRKKITSPENILILGLGGGLVGARIAELL